MRPFADYIAELRAKSEHIGTSSDEEGHSEIYETEGQLLTIIVTRIGGQSMEEIYTLPRWTHPEEYAEAQKELYEMYQYTPPVQTGVV